MEHSPGFLKLVNDAKSRIKETDVAGYKEMLRARREAGPGRYPRRSRICRGTCEGRGASEQGLIERDID